MENLANILMGCDLTFNKVKPELINLEESLSMGDHFLMLFVKELLNLLIKESDLVTSADN